MTGAIIKPVHQSRRGRGRPRRAGADEAILEVARTMLAERGYSRITVEAIADRAGVAKTTVYRRWPSKCVLVAAAIAPGTPDVTDPGQLLKETAAILSPFARSTDESEILGIIRAILAPRRVALANILEDPQKADELLGALWMRLFVGR